MFMNPLKVTLVDGAKSKVGTLETETENTCDQAASLCIEGEYDETAVAEAPSHLAEQATAVAEVRDMLLL